MLQRTQNWSAKKWPRIMPTAGEYRKALQGKRAAIYVGGAFKAFSLVRSLRPLGMKTVMVGSQTGNKEDYELLRELCDEGTILVDDTNPLELSQFLEEKDVDLFIGGVKERPIAYKLGIGFCDHNHERKEALAGFEGMLNFAREVHGSVMSPVWRLTPRKREHAPPRKPTRAADAGGVEMSTPVPADQDQDQESSAPQLGFHAQRLQGLRAAGRGAGDARHRRRYAVSAWLAGMRHLHAALPDQPFPRADGHCGLELQRSEHDLRRRRKPEAGAG